MRDGDSARYGGQGVLRAVFSVTSEIGKRLIGFELPPQEALDILLFDLDGTPDKSRLGANAILGVSMAAARLRAMLEGKSLFASLGGPEARLLPVPCFNLMNGGCHADNPLDFQEFMVVPAGRPTFREALRAGAEIHQSLSAILRDRGLSTSVGDEGGFAPGLTHPTEAMDLLLDASRAAGYVPGKDVFLALDVAASRLFEQGKYVWAGQRMDAEDMVGTYKRWLSAYPILSIEDGFAEDDSVGWRMATEQLGSTLQLVGDDLFVSDPARVNEGIVNRKANAVLLKPNQIGSVTEIVWAAQRVESAGGFRCMMSHRSGETLDDFIADLAVALGIGQIKAGAPARERIAKYNRLLRIERELGSDARFEGRNAFAVW